MARQGEIEEAWRLTNPPPLPPLAAHLWAYFTDLSNTRPGGGLGPSRLSRLEIQAWEQDEGLSLERWERRAILALDAAFLATMSAPQPKERSS